MHLGSGPLRRGRLCYPRAWAAPAAAQPAPRGTPPAAARPRCGRGARLSHAQGTSRSPHGKKRFSALPVICVVSTSDRFETGSGRGQDVKVLKRGGDGCGRRGEPVFTFTTKTRRKERELGNRAQLALEREKTVPPPIASPPSPNTLPSLGVTIDSPPPPRGVGTHEHGADGGGHGHAFAELGAVLEARDGHGDHLRPGSNGLRNRRFHGMVGVSRLPRRRDPAAAVIVVPRSRRRSRSRSSPVFQPSGLLRGGVRDPPPLLHRRRTLRPVAGEHRGVHLSRKHAVAVVLLGAEPHRHAPGDLRVAARHQPVAGLAVPWGTVTRARTAPHRTALHRAASRHAAIKLDVGLLGCFRFGDTQLFVCSPQSHPLPPPKKNTNDDENMK